MNEPAPERNNRRSRGRQALGSKCGTDARLTRVRCQCGANRAGRQSGPNHLLARFRTDRLWYCRIAVRFTPVQQSYVTEQIGLRGQRP